VHLCRLVAIDVTVARGFAPGNLHLHAQRHRPESSSSQLFDLTNPTDDSSKKNRQINGEASSCSDDAVFRRDFSADFQLEFEELMRWRRDVRRFRKDKPVDEDILNRALSTAFHSAPSVGLSEPWRIVRVESKGARDAALNNFMEQNAKALEGYEGDDDKKQTYASLKLSGMKEAPVQLAIYCDEASSKGSGLGARSMPEMKRYSVVSAITLFWLAARSFGLGVGWVSIIDPVKLTKDLGLSNDWTLVGYLCVGWPDEDNDAPELERFGWENRTVIEKLAISTA